MVEILNSFLGLGILLDQRRKGIEEERDSLSKGTGAGAGLGEGEEKDKASNSSEGPREG